MVRPIIKNQGFLARKSLPATEKDMMIGADLMDTFLAHKDECVGLAANMIGTSKCIIVFDDEGRYAEMFNPEIIAQSGAYETEEGCLSLDGERRCRRYTKIKVRWQSRDGKVKIKNFTGRTAQIIQHEMDHCEGKII